MRGFNLKGLVAREVARLGHEVVDVGAYDAQPSDYPDFAECVGDAVVGAKADRGISFAAAASGRP